MISSCILFANQNTTQTVKEGTAHESNPAGMCHRLGPLGCTCDKKNVAYQRVCRCLLCNMHCRGRWRRTTVRAQLFVPPLQIIRTRHIRKCRRGLRPKAKPLYRQRINGYMHRAHHERNHRRRMQRLLNILAVIGAFTRSCTATPKHIKKRICVIRFLFFFDSIFLYCHNGTAACFFLFHRNHHWILFECGEYAFCKQPFANAINHATHIFIFTKK